MAKYKEIFMKWWCNDTKVFQITNYKECWEKPVFSIHENGGRRKNGDKCFDVSIIIGYTVFNYTNFDLQHVVKGQCRK